MNDKINNINNNINNISSRNNFVNYQYESRKIINMKIIIII